MSIIMLKLLGLLLQCYLSTTIDYLRRPGSESYLQTSLVHCYDATFDATRRILTATRRHSTLFIFLVFPHNILFLRIATHNLQFGPQ
jgi:hypothetical protein